MKIIIVQGLKFSLIQMLNTNNSSNSLILEIFLYQTEILHFVQNDILPQKNIRVLSCFSWLFHLHAHTCICFIRFNSVFLDFFVFFRAFRGYFIFTRTHAFVLFVQFGDPYATECQTPRVNHAQMRKRRNWPMAMMPVTFQKGARRRP